MERLVKKFGFDIVQKFVPEKSPIAKMLANAKKIQRRSQKAREEAASNKLEHNEDDESDDDNVKGIEFSNLLISQL